VREKSQSNNIKTVLRVTLSALYFPSNFKSILNINTTTMETLTKDYVRIVLIMIIMVITAALGSCGPRYHTEQVFIPVDSIVYKDTRQVAFLLNGQITTRNIKYINVINDSVGVIITRTVRR
jgi:hypothetical protein